MSNIQSVMSQIRLLPENWHGSGPMDDSVLHAIARHASRLGPIEFSLETGAGKSTLLLSHLSQHHVVFTKNVGQSLSRVQQSPLLNASRVEFVEGPTQLTLPKYPFPHQLQMALLDGPHGYPFPDLEYYHIYPHIDRGGLLIVDDTNIPTIKRMADILKKDEMFALVETVGKTTFFLRTDAPLFDPLADGWWNQGYNQSFLHRTDSLRRVKKRIPKTLLNRIPKSLKLLLQRFL